VTSLNTGGNMTTGGSGGNVDGMLGASSAKMNQTFSFDPYSASSSKRGQGNQTVMLTSENPFNPQPSAREIQMRESLSTSSKPKGSRQSIANQ